MMLSSNDTGEHRGAKRTLICHNKLVEHVALLVSRESGHDLMMFELGQAIGRKGAKYTIMLNIAWVDTFRIQSFGRVAFAERLVKGAMQYGSHVFKINGQKLLLVLTEHKDGVDGTFVGKVGVITKNGEGLEVFLGLE